MEKKIIIRNVKVKEHTLVKEFFESYYGKNYCEVEYNYFKWLHNENPFNEGDAEEDEFTAFAAFENNNIISCINYVPMDLYIDGNKYHSTWSVGWLTKEGYSVISGLLLRKNFLRYNYYMSMGATQWVKTIYITQFGFEYQHNIPRLIMIGNAEETIRLLTMNKDLKINDFSNIYKWCDETKRSSEKGEIFIIKDINDLRKNYWTDHLKRSKATVAKNKKYFEWRYFNHPYIKYDIISADKNYDSGLAVLRIEKMRDSEYKICRMTDFLPTINNEKKLASAVAQYLLKNKIVFLDFFVVLNYF